MFDVLAGPRRASPHSLTILLFVLAVIALLPCSAAFAEEGAVESAPPSETETPAASQETGPAAPGTDAAAEPGLLSREGCEEPCFFFNLQAAPALAFFIGGGAEEVGAGFSASTLFLFGPEDRSNLFGFRFDYAAHAFTQINSLSGQELREQFFIGSAAGILRVDENLPLWIDAYFGGGAVLSKADVYFFGPPLRMSDSGVVIAMGAEIRYEPIEHAYLFGGVHLMRTYGGAAEWAEFNFRLDAGVGFSY